MFNLPLQLSFSFLHLPMDPILITYYVPGTFPIPNREGKCYGENYCRGRTEDRSMDMRLLGDLIQGGGYRRDQKGVRETARQRARARVSQE